MATEASDDLQWLLLTEGKTAEDIASKRGGIGQLLLAMTAVFANYGKVVLGVALVPSEFSILKMAPENKGEIVIKCYTKECDATKPFNLWPIVQCTMRL